MGTPRVLVSLVWLHLSAGIALASLAGEWVPKDDPQRRLTLRDDGSVELRFAGSPPRQMYISVILEMAPGGIVFGYGITARSDAKYSPSDPKSRVHQIAVPIDSYVMTMGGTWTASGDSLHLAMTEMDIPEIDGVRATEYITRVIRQGLEDASLDEQTRAGLTEALEHVFPISVSQDDPLARFAWRARMDGARLTITGPDDEYSGDWERVETGTVVGDATWGRLKADLSQMR